MRTSNRSPILPALLLGFGALLMNGKTASAQVAGELAPIEFGDADWVWDEPFFEGATYDPSVPTPDRILARPNGSRLAHHQEINAAFKESWSGSARMTVRPYGRTYEGRELIYAVITSPENHARLQAIKADIARLFDPRGLSDSEASEIIERTPAIAWLGYSIHGDETSGADASLGVAYHLLAGQDESVMEVLRNVVVVMDPCMNPDGRERILSQIEQNSGRVGNLDGASMHRGRWPFGRGNHYLFDMNRDWMTGICPETRGRWKVLREFPPQLFVDGHEMSGYDTFLFYPQAKPHHPQLPERLLDWQKLFADANAKAFDRFGWGYYTREWADAWAPFYSDAWGSLNGAIGMLYEQGSVGGQPLKRASGEIVPYRESVHGHVVASFSNLSTLVENRVAILTDYLEHRRRGPDTERPGAERAFVIVPGRHPEREWRLLDALMEQSIEVFVATRDFDAADVVSVLAAEEDERQFPKGAYVVPAGQPQASLVEAYLSFDPRLDEESVLKERKSLETKSESKMYDVTAWHLGGAFALDAYWCTPRDLASEPLESAAARPGAVTSDSPDVYAWLVDGDPDGALRFAVQAFEQGLAMHISDEEFRARVSAPDSEESVLRSFPRGSLLVRRHENSERSDAAPVDERVARAARDSGVQVFATSTGRSPDDGPDLGGGHFELLARPRAALVSNAPVSPSDFGHLWHYLDVQLRLPVTLLDAQELGGTDLRRYNVIILPQASRLESILKPHAEKLRAWVRSGGTLVACGRSAAALTGDDFELSSVKLRRNALEELDAYAFAAELEQEARETKVDFDDLWNGPTGEADAPPVAEQEDEGTQAPQVQISEGSPKEIVDSDAARRDRWMRRFAPAGVILRARARDDHWITSGCPEELPVFVAGSYAFVAREPVQVAVRLAEERGLRLGGLLWPEARERLADSAWLTVESKGHGQVILFAAPPVFRGFWRGTARLFGNAVVFGPGAGASPPRDW